MEGIKGDVFNGRREGRVTIRSCSDMKGVMKGVILVRNDPQEVLKK